MFLRAARAVLLMLLVAGSLSIHLSALAFVVDLVCFAARQKLRF